MRLMYYQRQVEVFGQVATSIEEMLKDINDHKDERPVAETLHRIAEIRGILEPIRDAAAQTHARLAVVARLLAPHED